MDVSRGIAKDEKMFYMDTHICVIHAYTHTHIHIHTVEYYSALSKKEIRPFVAMWMNLEGVMLSKTSWTKKDKCSMVSHKCGLKKRKLESRTVAVGLRFFFWAHGSVRLSWCLFLCQYSAVLIAVAL